ncbi:MAG: hypothetical protein M3460_03325 [Actinomycetota bacterium]|nr:hypothetical protein [Actinomycetota bacterium]
MTAPHSPTSPDDTKRKIDLNMTQVAAAALAAVTAAVVGSKLGAAGTVIGAAGASMVTTIGTAVYRASLERSRERVRALAKRTRPLPTSREGATTEHAYPAEAASAQVWAAANQTTPDDKRLTDTTDRGSQPSDHSRRLSTLRWGAVVVGTLGAFVLAMMVITGFEWASGEAVGGNGKGTTIGQVITDQSGPPKPAIPPPPLNPGESASETPTWTTSAPDIPTTTTTPDGGAGVEPSPFETSDKPTPSKVTTTPPLIPTQLPGVGG